jgi:CBS domain-containing protein
MFAADVMSAPVYIVSPEDLVSHARNLMLKHKISRVPVVDTDKLVGIITKKDIAYRLRQSEPIWRRRPIDRIPVHVLMVGNPITVTPKTQIQEVAALMITHDISGLPVLDHGSIAGIVTKSDILKSSAVQQLNFKVADLMTDVVTVSRYHSLDHVIDLMSERSDKVVVANNDGTIAGIITESNVAFFTYLSDKIGVPERDVTILRKDDTGRKRFRYVMELSTVAEDVMSRPVITIEPEAPVGEAVRLMRESNITGIVVIKGSEIKGIVKRDDIIREVAK